MPILAAAILAGFLFVVLDYVLLASALTREEDGLTESVSALTFLLAAVVACRAMWTSAAGGPRIVAAMIGASALLGFLDEISFGRTLVFRYREPVIYGKPIDGAHDFFSVGYDMLVTEFSGIMLWAVLAALVAAGLGMLWLMRRIMRDLDSQTVGLRYLVCGCAIVFLAIVIDLGFATSDFAYAMEEILELDTALVLTAGAAAQLVENRAAAAASWPPASMEPSGIRTARTP